MIINEQFNQDFTVLNISFIHCPVMPLGLNIIKLCCEVEGGHLWISCLHRKQFCKGTSNNPPCTACVQSGLSKCSF